MGYYLGRSFKIAKVEQGYIIEEQMADGVFHNISWRLTENGRVYEYHDTREEAQAWLEWYIAVTEQNMGYYDEYE